MNKKKKRVYIEPKYHVVSIGSIHSLIGKPVKIHKNNGNIIVGSIQKIQGNDVVVKQRINNGVATTPISMAKISKLEVYR